MPVSLSITPTGAVKAAANTVTLSFTGADLTDTAGALTTLDIDENDIFHVQDGSFVEINGVKGSIVAASNFAKNEIAFSASAATMLGSIRDWINANFELSYHLTPSLGGTTLTLTSKVAGLGISVEFTNLDVGGASKAYGAPTSFKLRENFAIVGRITDNFGNTPTEDNFKVYPLVKLNAAKTAVESYTITKDISRIIKDFLYTPIPSMGDTALLERETMFTEFKIDFSQGWGNPFSPTTAETPVTFKAYAGAYKDSVNMLSSYTQSVGRKFLRVYSSQQNIFRGQYLWLYYYHRVTGHNLKLTMKFYDHSGTVIDFGSTTCPANGYEVVSGVSDEGIYELGVGLPQVKDYISGLTGVTDADEELAAVTRFTATMRNDTTDIGETMQFYVKEECCDQIVFLSSFQTYTSVASFPILEKSITTEKQFIELGDTSYAQLFDRAAEIIDSDEYSEITLYIRRDWYGEELIQELFAARDVLWVYKGNLVRVQPVKNEATYYNSQAKESVEYKFRISGIMDTTPPARPIKGDPDAGAEVEGPG